MSEPPYAKSGPALSGDSILLSARKTRARAEGGSKKGRFYKPLPKKFRRDGFTYRRIAREGNAAMYEQVWSGCPNPSVCYEVIRIRYRGGFQIGEKFVEPYEVYPNSNTWGAFGFTLTDKEAAFAKLLEINTAPNSLACFEQKEASRTEKSPT